MFKVIALAFLVATTMATFSVNLESQTIEDSQYVIFTQMQGNPARAVPVSKASPVIADGDKVYTYKTKVNDKEEHVVFDTTVGDNWQVQEAATPVIAGSETVEVAQGRAQLTKAEKSSLEKVDFGGNDLTDVTVLKSSQPAANANKGLFKASNYGLALNRQYQQNFFQTLVKSHVKLEDQGKGFSFYFSDKVNQLFFGKPQEFFAESTLEKIDAKTQEHNNQWVIPVKKQGISIKGLDALSYKDPSFATFDTTTRYIWAAKDLVDSIVAKLNTNSLNCLDVNQQNHIGLYECNEGEFPELQFQFRSMDASDAEDTKIYSVKNYTEKLENGKVRLLVREAGLYQNTTSAASKVPKTTVNSKSNNLVILGTVFLENVYTYFSYDDHTVNMAQAYDLQPQETGIGYTARLWFLILGAIGALAAIALILASLKKVPYVPSAEPSVPAPVQQMPVQTVSYVPQTITQSYVKSAQPVYYVQQQQPQRVASPQRFVQSQAPQQQYYVQ